MTQAELALFGLADREAIHERTSYLALKLVIANLQDHRSEVLDLALDIFAKRMFVPQDLELRESLLRLALTDRRGQVHHAAWIRALESAPPDKE
jgi:hypothetical protein